jgi:hypothetical protein
MRALRCQEPQGRANHPSRVREERAAWDATARTRPWSRSHICRSRPNRGWRGACRAAGGGMLIKDSRGRPVLGSSRGGVARVDVGALGRGGEASRLLCHMCTADCTAVWRGSAPRHHRHRHRHQHRPVKPHRLRTHENSCSCGRLLRRARACAYPRGTARTRRPSPWQAGPPASCHMAGLRQLRRSGRPCPCGST